MTFSLERIDGKHAGTQVTVERLGLQGEAMCEMERIGGSTASGHDSL
jgi:hypothetical protein